MEHNVWIADLIGEDTRRTASSKAGMSESTLSRQLSRGTLRPEMVIALCRAYGRKPVDGLVETGYLQPWEIEGVGIDTAIDQATNKQLLDGIMRRSDPEAQYLFGRTEDVINPEMDDRNNVVDLRSDSPHSFGPEQGEPVETTPSVRPLEYVADSSDTEPEEGDDDYHDGP